MRLYHEFVLKENAGDWAGNSYATSGCPGTCEERLMDPKNFVVIRNFPPRTNRSHFLIQNASWSINSLKVYRKQLLANVQGAATPRLSTIGIWTLLTICISGTALILNI